MTLSLVLTNHKGGVAKSTSATNLAFGIVNGLRQIGASNNRVLLVDTDSQAHASLVTTGRNDSEATNNLYGVVMAERKEAPSLLINSLVQSKWDEDLHVLPASHMLDRAERELTGIAGAPYRLAEVLSRISNHYAAIVIDTRPSFSLMTEMALLAATDALIPVEPRYLETVGLLSVLSKIQDIRESWRHPQLHVEGILVTKMNHRISGHKQLLAELKTHPDLGQLLYGVIPSNEAVSYSLHNHMSVFQYDPSAPASKAYAEVVARLVQRIVSQGAYIQ